MSAKDILLDVAASLPADATLADAIHQLEFRRAIEEGLESLEREETVSADELRNMIPGWIAKYSSPTKR